MSATAAPEVVHFLAEHPPFDALEAGELERVAAAAEAEFHRAGATIFSSGSRAGLAPARRPRRRGRDRLRRPRARSARRGRAVRALPRCCPDCRRASRRAPARTRSATGSPPRWRRSLCRARPGCASSPARCWTFATRAAAAVATEPGVDPPLQPVGSLLRGDPVVCRPDTPIREAAELMTAAHVTSAVVNVGDGVARDPHRSRPAHARGRVRADRGRAGVGGDVGAGLHLPAGPARGRRPARHARPRLSALPGGVGDRDDPRGHRGDRPRRRADALVVLSAPADRASPDRR